MKRLAGAVVLGVVVLSVGGALPFRRAGASDGFFRAAARADAWRLSYADTSVPVFPGGEIVDGSPATAEVLIDGSGASTALASAPYPGAQLAALPTVANGATPGAPFPAYPFMVTTAYPGNPKAEQTRGHSRLEASSEEVHGAAEAVVGALPGDPAIGEARAWAETGRDPATGMLTSRADSAIEGLAVGSVLRIGRIAGHAVLTAAPGKEPVRESHLSVGTITVNGQEAGLTDRGLQPASGSSGVDTGALERTLAEAGVTLRLLPSRQTPTSTDTAGLTIGITRDVPNRGRITATWTFGVVSVTADPGSAASVPVVEATPPGPAGVGNETPTMVVGAAPAPAPALEPRSAFRAPLVVAIPPSAAAPSPLAGTDSMPAVVAAPVLQLRQAPLLPRRLTGHQAGVVFSALGVATILLVAIAALVRHRFAGRRAIAATAASGPALRLQRSP